MSTPNDDIREITDGPDEMDGLDGPTMMRPPQGLSPEETLNQDEIQQFVQAVYLGRGMKEVSILGHKVTIRTLTVDEELQLSLLIKRWEDSRGYPRAYKTATVAAALIDIDGEPFYQAISPADEEVNQRWRKLKDNYYPAFVDLIYAEFTQLEQEVGGELARRLGKSGG